MIDDKTKKLHDEIRLRTNSLMIEAETERMLIRNNVRITGNP